jgi:ribose-phosphate pyrophosphokinase
MDNDNDNDTDHFSAIPVGPLGLIAMKSFTELGDRINEYIVGWRKLGQQAHSNHIDFPGHVRNSFLIKATCSRFGNGEGKATIGDTIRGYDLFILTDIGNYGCKFPIFGQENLMSPDDHFQDVKRIISAAGGKARRVNVIMPMLYEARQHKRVSRESLDCAMALQEIQNLGVDNIITFDAHDPKVQNAVPLIGFENIYPTYQIIKALLRSERNLEIDREKMLVVSPDAGGMNRNIYFANVLGLDVGMFYKRRDLTKIVDGRNPIVAHQYLGVDVEGKDILITDDMLDSGESVLDVAKELKKRKANRIYVAVTFGLFTSGVQKFDEYYRDGIITKVFSTNLTYRREELKKAPWYVEVDMAKYISYIIEALNHDESISLLLNPTTKISILLDKYKRERQKL